MTFSTSSNSKILLFFERVCVECSGRVEKGSGLWFTHRIGIDKLACPEWSEGNSEELLEVEFLPPIEEEVVVNIHLLVECQIWFDIDDLQAGFLSRTD
jgi:hypothetical protein